MKRSNLQKIASQRNWAKARVAGMTTYDMSLFTDEELDIFIEIKDLQWKLLGGWDRNTIKFLSKFNEKDEKKKNS